MTAMRRRNVAIITAAIMPPGTIVFFFLFSFL